MMSPIILTKIKEGTEIRCSDFAVLLWLIHSLNLVRGRHRHVKEKKLPPFKDTFFEVVVCVSSLNNFVMTSRVHCCVGRHALRMLNPFHVPKDREQDIAQ